MSGSGRKMEYHQDTPLVQWCSLKHKCPNSCLQDRFYKGGGFLVLQEGSLGDCRSKMAGKRAVMGWEVQVL